MQILKLWVASVALFFSVSQAQAARAVFKDEQLRQILQNSKAHQTSGVIYTWSPHMNLSSTGAYEIQKIAEELELELTLLVDPRSTEEEIAKSAQDYTTRNAAYLGSSELSKKSIYVHYPSLIIYKNGKFKGSVRPGYDEPTRVRAYILRSLK